jgi:hypothetical protein
MAGAPSAVAEEPERHLPEIAAVDSGHEALVNTLGLRAAKQKFVGRYVTVADGKRRMQTREANQMFAEFGLFRDVGARFKLLGADGKWVRIRWNENAQKFQAGTWGNNWNKAWSFKLVRPKTRTMPQKVKSELIKLEINKKLPVCVLAFSAKGFRRGFLKLSGHGVMVLDEDITCGANTSTLFMTDSLPRKTPPRTVTQGVEIDPITYIRYVAPDNPALSLTVVERRAMRNEVIDYFDKLINYNRDLQGRIDDEIGGVSDLLLTTSFEIPGEEAEDVNLIDFFVEQATTWTAFLGPEAAIISAAVKSIYDTVMLGITIANNQSLEGPRIVESITNEVLVKSEEIRTHYGDAFLKAGENLERLRDSILEGCTNPTTCVSDRKLAAWWDADPTAGVTDEVRSLAMEQTVASHEKIVWKRLLPIRGLLYQPGAWFSMRGNQYWDCSPGYPYETGYNNEDIVTQYAIWAVDAPDDETWGPPIVTTHLYRPYHNWYTCWTGESVSRSYISAWTVGLANDDEAAVTPLSGLHRLFSPWDPNEPVTSGFGLPPQEIACEWLRKDARGYTGRHGFYFNPCHAAFYDVDGDVVSPYELEDPHYDDALPWAATYWRPLEAELAAGRSVADPDVVSPMTPHLTFASCDAWDDDEIVSTAGGGNVKVAFTNLHDGDIDVYWIEVDGSTSHAFTLPRQDQLQRPFAGDSATGQFILEYSDLVNTTAGTAFLVRANGTCLGTWTTVAAPAGAAVDYQVAEIHGDDGILLAPTP